MNKNAIPAYNMKYAMTSGIRKIWLNGALVSKGRYWPCDEHGKTRIWHSSLSRNEVAFTEDEAREKFEILRQKKLKSLTKSLNKIKNLEFEVRA